LHIIPDLVRLEAKYPGVLVVIGVHSPKFPHEKMTASIRKAVLRYKVTHPVVNDANLVLWRRFGISQWPTFALIDPEGRFYGKVGGEGLYEVLDMHIGKLVKQFRDKKLLKETPMHFALVKDRTKSPLFFPGKVLADAAGKRLFIADSTNNRVVITDLEGKKIAVAGTGKEGAADGPFGEATFNEPQGMALMGETLYVADRKNHLIRALDLKGQTVRTVAGTGVQDRNFKFRSAPALKIGLNSPWDILTVGNRLYIAMAGHHQIWVMEPARGLIGTFAGSGNEELTNGPLGYAAFAQPSGLATDGRNLFVADSESSAIRSLPVDGRGQVKTIVGSGLFVFGDVNGSGGRVRLQHPLGVAYLKGKLYVADSYNHKIKLIDPFRGSSATFAGEVPAKGEQTFYEPGGVSIGGNKLYVADTNAHRIRVVDMQTRAVTTLTLQGVDPVPQEEPKTETEAPAKK
jgi:sugar lactone lactonase YvrE